LLSKREDPLSSDIDREVAHQLDIIRRGTEEIISEEELAAKIKKSLETGKPLRVKQGFDPTAPDIHLGHAVGIRKLRDFQNLGHTVVLIIGDYTALIGDPSGRSKTRPRLSAEEVRDHARTYIEQFSRIVDPETSEIRYNGEWFSKMSFLECLNLTGLTTVARILERDDFEKRFKAEAPIGLHELMYPIMQAYDSVAIEADVELGGTEQKFNLLLGRQMQQHKGLEPQVAVTVAILEGISGKDRMSKSLGNYVGITDEPVDMYGKVMSIPDELILHYFRLATEIDETGLAEVDKTLKAGVENPKNIKARLASEIVRMYHGQNAAETSALEFEKRFGQLRGTTDLDAVETVTIEVADDRIWIVNLLRESGLVKSGGDARRKIVAGAVRIDQEKVTDADFEVPVGAGEPLLISLGRQFKKILLKKTKRP
jgi:tyrosyl-tRNA synthetase